MLYAAKSHIGLVRQMNQDGYSVEFNTTPYHLMVVADGMGGALAGEVASRLAVDTVRETVIRSLTDSTLAINPEQLLASSVEEANRVIYATAQIKPEYAGMGTTLVAALVNEHHLIFGNIGDSRGYLYQGEQLRQVTHDHSLVAELVRRGQLTEDEAHHHPQRNIVTRSLGTADVCQVDVERIPWGQRDVVLLCSDGLSNLFTIQELAARTERASQAASTEELESIADELIQTSLARGGPDNITLVLAVHREGAEQSW